MSREKNNKTSKDVWIFDNPYQFRDNTSKFNQLKEGDVLIHRNKKVITVKKNEEWGYVNKGDFIPFLCSEDHTNAIQFGDGEYWDLDYAERIGNVFEESFRNE